MVIVLLNGRELLQTTEGQADMVGSYLRGQGWTIERIGDRLLIERGEWRNGQTRRT